MSSAGQKKFNNVPLDIDQIDRLTLMVFAAEKPPGVEINTIGMMTSSMQVSLKIGHNGRISFDTSDNTVTFTGTDDELKALKNCKTLDEFIAAALEICNSKPDPKPDLQ